MIRYNLILADPAWSFLDRLTMSQVKRGAEANYAVLDNDAIKALPIKEIAADDSLLALWVPSSILQTGLEVMKAWGFRHTQTVIWVKTKLDPFKDFKTKLRKNKLTEQDFDQLDYDSLLQFLMGRVFRQSHEVVLLGVRGKIYSQIKNKSQRSVIFAPNIKHSQKPEILQDRLEKILPNGNKIELFARRERAGWLCIGNEAPATLNEDIRDSLKKLIIEDAPNTTS